MKFDAVRLERRFIFSVGTKMELRKVYNDKEANSRRKAMLAGGNSERIKASHFCGQRFLGDFDSLIGTEKFASRIERRSK
jgi:hypothetical protein